MPALAFSHVGLWVFDPDRMERFYRDVLGFTMTDSGMLGPSRIVFMSRDPAEHHQISLRTRDLAELRGWFRRVRDAAVDDLQPVTHGNAISIYFRDPEGNRIEIFIDTPWYTTQPFRVPLDLDRPDAEIWQEVEALCRRSPGTVPRPDWEAAMRARMERG
jgi:catechol-2,3-dioxygenase